MEKDYVFQRLNPESTGIDFQNILQPTDSINILAYEYFYNGGGVGVGDFNRDGLQDIVFTGNQVPSRIYINEGNFNFKDITASSGIDTNGSWCTGVSVADVNADGYDDIYINVGGPGNKDQYPNRLYINQQDLTFTESAAAYGLEDSGETNQAVFFDYDRDGDLDVYLLTGGGFERSAIVARPIFANRENRNTDHLLQNNYDSLAGHPVFTDVSVEAGIRIEGFGLGAAIIDVNNDLWPDIYITNDYLSRDLLYVNNQNGTFSERSLELLKHTSHFSMGCDVGDINNDGLEDVITLDMLPEDHKRKMLMYGPEQYDLFQMAVIRGYGYQYMRNMLQLNTGNGFSEIGQLAGIHRTDWSWAPLLADFNNDGFEDLYVTNGYGADITDLDFVKFRRSMLSPFSDSGEVRSRFLDSLEKRPSISVPNYMFTNNRDLTFTKMNAVWLAEEKSLSNGAAYADLDNDGDLDLIVNNIDQPAFIFNNRTVENDTATSYLKISLSGKVPNTQGIGAKIKIYAGDYVSQRTLHRARGYQSSMSSILHFGLGNIKMVDSLEVIWPDGMRQIKFDISANQHLVLNYEDARSIPKMQSQHQPAFIASDRLNIHHEEVEFNDFRKQPLLLQAYSGLGPATAVGDCNGDGRDDLFVGGSYQKNARLYLQLETGDFEIKTLPTTSHEDTGAAFFDMDNDGDLDIYIASGGYEAGNVEFYQDRIYRNEGNGEYLLEPHILPAITSSTKCVVAYDYDQDGDTDLFVGGRISHNQYPKIPRSYLLENQNGRFVDKTESVDGLSYAGMIDEAHWIDFDNDGIKDLVIAGEFMPVKIFLNTTSGLKLMSSNLKDYPGFYSAISAVDVDNDGDVDIVAGNLGLNHDFDVHEDQPMEVYFDAKSPLVTPVFSAYEEGRPYPVASFDLLGTRMPVLKKSIQFYYQYADATTSQILRILGGSFDSHKVTLTRSVVFVNEGNGHFAMHDLPKELQIAPVQDFMTMDINNDGFTDILAVGNNYYCEVVRGRYDASQGWVMINDGKGNFTPLKNSGFEAIGDSRQLLSMKIGDRKAIVVTKNNGRFDAYYLQGTPLHQSNNELANR